MQGANQSRWRTLPSNAGTPSRSYSTGRRKNQQRSASTEPATSIEEKIKRTRDSVRARKRKQRGRIEKHTAVSHASFQVSVAVSTNRTPQAECEEPEGKRKRRRSHKQHTREGARAYRGQSKKQHTTFTPLPVLAIDPLFSPFGGGGWSSKTLAGTAAAGAGPSPPPTRSKRCAETAPRALPRRGTSSTRNIAAQQTWPRARAARRRPMRPKPRKSEETKR